MIFSIDSNLKDIIKNSNRNINKNIVRDLLYKRISKLEKKLESVCEKYETKLHIIDESYTSLTCYNCMQVKEKKNCACLSITYFMFALWYNNEQIL
jgi:transposase